MRIPILLFALSISACADQFVFSKDGRTVTAGPRELPSVGVRLDTGQAVLGLHGADGATQAACGWYRVLPAQTKIADTLYVSARAYTIEKATAQEVLTLAEKPIRKTLTPEERIGEIFDDLTATTDDARVSALVRAVASTITNKLASSITITIPPVKQREAIK